MWYEEWGVKHILGNCMYISFLYNYNFLLLLQTTIKLIQVSGKHKIVLYVKALLHFTQTYQLYIAGSFLVEQSCMSSFCSLKH